MAEVYSDFKNGGANLSKVTAAHNRKDVNVSSSDNLFCLGEVVEYSSTAKRDPLKMCLVVSIIDIAKETHIVLQSGAILRPKSHLLRKVQIYCSTAENLIPNPLL